MIGIDLVLR